MEEQKKSSFSRSLLIGISGFFLGFLACIFWQRLLPFNLQWNFSRKSSGPSVGQVIQQFNALQNPEDDQIDLENDQDPFAMMQKLRKQAMDRMLNDSGAAEGSSGVQVNQREDQHAVYLDIMIAGLDSENLNVEVKDSLVTLKGYVVKKNDDGSEAQRSFHEQFSVPDGVDAQKVEIDHDKDKLILKFPKG